MNILITLFAALIIVSLVGSVCFFLYFFCLDDEEKKEIMSMFKDDV